MGFFKKLKKRLFTLNVKESNDFTEKNSTTNNAKWKLDKKIEKELLAKRKKENKINKYVAGLDKTGKNFSTKIKELQTRNNKVDEEFFEELEEILIMSDISSNFVMEIVDEIKKEVKLENISDSNLISEIIADKLFAVYANQSIVDTKLSFKTDRLNVYIMVGVNGAGKTTTIAKIAKKYIDEGKKVLLAAGDTFRAGAVAQLKIWANRVGADIVVPKKENADPASVVFEALKKTKSSDYDLLIIDTAGRLQNKVNLMNELEKISKIIQREIPSAPHESLLVLDSTTGQNGVSQAVNFKDVTNLTGIILTKMDGTSKGGIILTIKDKLNLPVKFIGLGEKLDDLQEFDLDAFIYGMTKELMDNGN